ncbi:hypothetical protein PHYSODRAFT_325361 [Phytophthora sojae]|uniref:Uncharacterized protein n=1 Tax=Phytophthora sojae (strain P6497) TaxID=1094619 RepID=G4YSU9_PHYSP|nr:hypothetical protein PHYSODRAFT_325361 [Phytophthora sojae]EGZ24221.1 hypothetical protein PHYSODRAFT_325361 [Phytophthora sojae]|eukprot:XP_009519509.1 hypothetical protein PHYSODRAFT_325361 [Phytophthora sojae]
MECAGGIVHAAVTSRSASTNDGRAAAAAQHHADGQRALAIGLFEAAGAGALRHAQAAVPTSKFKMMTAEEKIVSMLGAGVQGGVMSKVVETPSTPEAACEPPATLISLTPTASARWRSACSRRRALVRFATRVQPSPTSKFEMKTGEEKIGRDVQGGGDAGDAGGLVRFTTRKQPSPTSKFKMMTAEEKIVSMLGAGVQGRVMPKMVDTPSTPEAACEPPATRFSVTPTARARWRSACSRRRALVRFATRVQQSPTSKSKPRRDVDDDPADLFDGDRGTQETPVVISATSSSELHEILIGMSQPPCAMPGEAAPVCVEVSTDLKGAIPMARDEASTQFTTTHASNTHVSAVHIEPRNSTRKNSTQKMSTRDASKEMRQQELGNHPVMSVSERTTTRPQPRLGSDSDFDDRLNLEVDALGHRAVIATNTTCSVTSAAPPRLRRPAAAHGQKPWLASSGSDSVSVATTSRRPLGTARASTTPEQSRYDARVRPVSLDALKQLNPGRTLDVRLRSSRDAPRLWVTRSKTWVTTMFKTKIERQTYLRVTNITDETITLDADMTVGWWTPSDVFPSAPRFVLATNRHYQDWQNLAYEVTWDDDETWRDDELVWPMYGWPTDEDLESDGRRGEQEEEDRTGSEPRLYPVAVANSLPARPTCASEAAASPDDKSLKYGPSTWLRETTTEIAVVRTTCVRSDQGSRRSDYARRPDEAPGTEQQVEDSSGEVVRGVQFYGSSRQWGEMRQPDEGSHVEKSSRDESQKCDSVRRVRWNVAEQSDELSQKCDAVRRREYDTVRQPGEGSLLRWTECDTVRQPSEGALRRDDLRLAECDSGSRSDAKSQKCDSMRPAEKGGGLHRWSHSAVEIVKNKSNATFDAVEEGHRIVNLELLSGLKRHEGASFAVYRGDTEYHGVPPEGLLVEVPGATRRMHSGVEEPAARKTVDEGSAAILTSDPGCTTSPVLLRRASTQGRGARCADWRAVPVRAELWPGTRTQVGDAAETSSQTWYAKAQRRPEDTGEPGSGERGQRPATAGFADAMHRAMDGAGSAKTHSGYCSAECVEPGNGDANTARAPVVVVQPADRSREDIRPRTLDPETASPANLVAEDCDAKKLDVENLDAKNRDEDNPVANVPELDPPTPDNMDLGRGAAHVLAVTMRSASACATNPRGRVPGVLQELAAQNPSSLVKTPPRAAKGAESHGPGHFTGRGALDEDAFCAGSGCAFKFLGRNEKHHRRLAQVNAQEVDQGVHVADRTRGGVATTDTAEVNLPIRYCLDCDSSGLPNELKRMSDALAGCELQRHECNATGNSSQTRCAETLHHREEIVRKPDATKHGQCRATDSHAEARRGAMGSAPDAARAQGGGIQPGAARNASRLSATRMPEVLHCAMDSHAEARRGAMDSGLDAARTQVAGIEPAATRNASSPIRRPVEVSKYVEGPTSVQLSAFDDAINRNPPCIEADWGFEVARNVSDATSDSSRDGTESTRRGIYILQNRRLAQVNVLVVGQARDDADRTRGDVEVMNRARVNSSMWYCWDRGGIRCARGLDLMLDAVSRGATLVSPYAVRLETGGTPGQFSVKDVSKLRPVRAMINGATPSNEPADCRDEMPLEVSRDTSAVKSDGVAYSKVRDKHTKTVRVVVDLTPSFRLARDRDPRCTSRAIIAVGKLPNQCAEPKRRSLQIGPRAQMQCVRLCAKAQDSQNESRRETSSSLHQLYFDVRTSKQNPVEEFPSHATTCWAVSTNGPFDSTDTCLPEHSPTLAPDEDASEGEKTLELHACRGSRHGCAHRESDATWRGYTDELDANCEKWRRDFSRQRIGRYRLGAIYSRDDEGRLNRSLVEILDFGNGRSEGLDEGSVEDQPVAEDGTAEGRLIKDVKKWKETKEKNKNHVLELRLQRLRVTTTWCTRTLSRGTMSVNATRDVADGDAWSEAGTLGRRSAAECDATASLGRLRCPERSCRPLSKVADCAAETKAKTMELRPNWETGTLNALISRLRYTETPDLDGALDLDGASEPEAYPRITSGSETGAAGAAARLDSEGHSVHLHRDGSFKSTDQVVGVPHPSSNRDMLVAVLDGHVALVFQLDYVSAGTVDLGARGLSPLAPHATYFQPHRAFFGVGHKERVIAPRRITDKGEMLNKGSASAVLRSSLESRSLTHLIPRDAARA